MPYIYLDYAATTPVSTASAEAVCAALGRFGNPSSRHGLGAAAAKELEAHRADVAGALGCGTEELFFTSGGTEGNNWSLNAAVGLGKRRGKHIITTAIEHSAVLEPIRELERGGYEVTYLKPGRDGRVGAAQVVDALRSDTVLVSMMLVNNELGTVQPVEETAQAIRASGAPALLHCDAVQGFLKVPFTPAQLGVDFLTVTGHKIYAPKGVGALYVRAGLTMPPMLRGGGQERGARPGTEATALIAGFAAAARVGAQELAARTDALRACRGYAIEALAQAVPEVKILVPDGAPHILPISLPGYQGETVVRYLSDTRGICISSGSACHKGKPSHVFAALNLPKPLQDGALRISLSHETTEAELDALTSALAGARDTLLPAMS